MCLVVQRIDKAIPRINHDSTDSVVWIVNLSDISILALPKLFTIVLRLQMLKNQM